MKIDQEFKTEAEALDYLQAILAEERNGMYLKKIDVRSKQQGYVVKLRFATPGKSK